MNGHVIERKVKKNGQAAGRTRPAKGDGARHQAGGEGGEDAGGQPLEGPTISVSRVLEIMDVRNPRRVNYRGGPAIVFDFVGRKDAKTHGMAEDASKKLQGTIWIDEADRQVAHLEVSFDDNFRVAGGFSRISEGLLFS